MEKESLAEILNLKVFSKEELAAGARFNQQRARVADKADERAEYAAVAKAYQAELKKRK